MNPHPHPRVSVIVPCYNYGHFLPETLNSVQQQSYTGWECIIVDDGSTDNTFEIAEKHMKQDQRFRYLYQENEGLSAARNTGIQNAKGKYLQFLDSDDLIEIDKLKQQLQWLEEHPTTDIVYGEARFFPDGNPAEHIYSIWGENKPWMPLVSGQGNDILKVLLVANIMVVSSPLLRKEVFQRCGLFDETLNSHEDWEFWIRCAQRGTYFQFLNKPATLTLIRFHQKSMSQSRAKMFKSNLQIRKVAARTLSNKDLITINNTLIHQVGYKLATDYIERKKRFLGFLYLAKYTLNLKDFSKFLYGCKVLVFGSHIWINKR